MHLTNSKPFHLRRLPCCLCCLPGHLGCFTCALFQPMKPLKAAATTSQPVLTSQQIETIFFKVPELYEIHKEFYDGLFPRVQQWSHQQRVGDLFQKLVSGLEQVHDSLSSCGGGQAPPETCGRVLLRALGTLR